MTDVKVISVNPGRKTLGALNSDIIERMARSCNPTNYSVSTPRLKSVCNFVFGIDKNVSGSWSSKLFFARLIVSAFLLSIAIPQLLTPMFGYDLILPVATVAVAGMILLGFFARMASFAGFVYAAYMSYLTGFDAVYTLQTILFIFMAMTGPGRYSIDQLLRRAIFKSSKRRRARRLRRAAEDRLSYKALRNA